MTHVTNSTNSSISSSHNEKQSETSNIETETLFNDLFSIVSKLDSESVELITSRLSEKSSIEPKLNSDAEKITLFTESIIKGMTQHSEAPIIFPLSNPVSRAEATPENIVRWTNGRAIIATGSPFQPVSHNGAPHRVAQCNNSYIFPGIGLGVLAVRAIRVSDEMLLASSEILAEASPKAAATGEDLLPPLQQITEVSKLIAFAVAKVAQTQGHALKISDAQLHARIDQIFWTPHYRTYKRISL